MEVFPAKRTKFISLFFPGRISLIEALDPRILKKPSQGSIQGASAQPYSAFAEQFNILH